MLYRISYTKFQANTYINISLCTFYQHLNLKQIFTNQLFNIYNVYQHMHAYQQNISWKHTSHYIHSLKHLSKTEPEMKYSMNHCIVYTVSPNMHHALISLLSLLCIKSILWKGSNYLKHKNSSYLYVYARCAK